MHINNDDIVFWAEIVWFVIISTAPPATAALEILLFGNTGLLVNVLIPPTVWFPVPSIKRVVFAIAVDVIDAIGHVNKPLHTVLFEAWS